MTLSWDQVLTWRLSQHSLLDRGGQQNLLDIVAQIGGVHAQLMSAAQLALSARVWDLSAADVQKALWVDRALVKSWTMRGTLHLVPVSDFPVYVSALGMLRLFKRPSWLKYHGVTLDELESKQGLSSPSAPGKHIGCRWICPDAYLIINSSLLELIP